MPVSVSVSVSVGSSYRTEIFVFIKGSHDASIQRSSARPPLLTLFRPPVIRDCEESGEANVA